MRRKSTTGLPPSTASVAKAHKGGRVGTGWLALCPVHDDRKPSLSIRDANGKVVVHCHAGCDQRDVIAALQARGLWDGMGCPSRRRSRRSKVAGRRLICRRDSEALLAGDES